MQKQQASKELATEFFSTAGVLSYKQVNSSQNWLILERIKTNLSGEEEPCYPEDVVMLAECACAVVAHSNLPAAAREHKSRNWYQSATIEQYGSWNEWRL